MRCTSPSTSASTSPGRQRPATVSASRVAWQTSAYRQAPAASAIAITSSSKRRDGSRTASAASACTGDRVGTTLTWIPSASASLGRGRAPPPGCPGRWAAPPPARRRSTGSRPADPRRTGSGAPRWRPRRRRSRPGRAVGHHHRRPRRRPGCPVLRRAARHVRPGRELGRANRVTEIRYGRPATTPASIAAPTSSTWTWTCQVAVAPARVAGHHERVAQPGQFRPSRSTASARRRAGTAPRTRTRGAGRSRRRWRSGPGRAGGGHAGGTVVRDRLDEGVEQEAEPAPPASTTPARARAGNCSGVRASAWSAAVGGGPGRRRAGRRCPPSAPVAAASTTVSRSPRPARPRPRTRRSAAARSAPASARPRTTGTPARASASPRRICDRIAPELPRAPSSAPRARCRSTRRVRSLRCPPRRGRRRRRHRPWSAPPARAAAACPRRGNASRPRSA